MKMKKLMMVALVSSTLALSGCGAIPRLDITGMWVFSLGVWFHIVARLVYSKPWMAFFLAELIAAILVLFGAYQVLDAWIARVSLEEREALEARQQAMMEGQQEGGHVSH